MKDINFIAILIFLFCFISCKIKTVNQVLNSETMDISNYGESTYFKLHFLKELIESYNNLNIKINNNYYDGFGYLAFYSKYDNDCMPDKAQMSINPYGNNFMVIKKDMLIEENEEDYNYFGDEDFYLCVYCLNDLNCYYKITFELNNYIIIPKNINFYNYYVNENEIFNFYLETNKNNINNNINENKNIYELYWIKRNNNKKFINFNNNLPEDYNGILLKSITNENAYINFSVRSNVGDYITIGRSIIDGNTKKEPLKINDIETLGYLEKEILTEECFLINSLKDKNIRNIYIRGIIYDKIAQIYYKESASEKRIIEGNFIEKLTMYQIKNGATICVSFVDELNKEYQSYNNITFMIQLFSNEIKNYNYYFNTLDIAGSSYLSMLSNDEIMILSNIITSNNNKVSITVNPIYGIPKIFIDICRIFPFCKYEDSFYLTNLEEL